MQQKLVESGFSKAELHNIKSKFQNREQRSKSITIERDDDDVDISEDRSKKAYQALQG